MNYPTIAQMLAEFSNQVKYKLDAVFHSMGFYETAGTVLARKFKEAAKEVINQRMSSVDLRGLLADVVENKFQDAAENAIKEKLRGVSLTAGSTLQVESMYVLPSGDAIKLSKLISVSAFPTNVGVATEAHSGFERRSMLTCVPTTSLEESVQVRDKILKDHSEFVASLNKDK